MSLYDRFGGKDALDKIIANFYLKVMSNDVTREFHEEVDMAIQKPKFRTFIAKVTGGPDEYKGRDLKIVHTGMNLEDEHFDTIVDLLCQAMKETKVPQPLIDELIAILAPYREKVVEIES